MYILLVHVVYVTFYILYYSETRDEGMHACMRRGTMYFDLLIGN